MRFIRVFQISLVVVLALVFTGCFAGGYQKKIKKNKAEIKAMANYVLTKYSNGALTKYMIITMDTVKDQKLVAFCKKFDIRNIYVYGAGGSESRYLSYTISFFKNYTPLVGKKTEVIVDYKNDEQKRAYPFPQSIKKIDENIYYSQY
ncbi:MAG TPA: hypothetical protein VL728_09070 [Cyclobacteriaceae bacterium]|jgi:hypothetical protein|nr:hypothetical protein [Cyclobacteriaceae bacterium]